MANLRICYKNLALSATVTASPVADSTMPVGYLQNSSRGYVFRSTSTATQTILGDWGGTAYTINMFALNRCNLIDGDTVRMQLYSDAAQTTQIYDSGTIAAFTTGLYADWAYKVVAKYFTAVAAVKSFKLTIVSATNPVGYIEISEMFIGSYTEATYSPKFGLSLGWADNSTQTRRGGTLSVNTQEQWRTMSFDMMLTTEADRTLWMEIGRYCSKSITVFLSVFPVDTSAARERDYQGFWKFDQSPAQKISEFNLYDFSLTINET